LHSLAVFGYDDGYREGEIPSMGKLKHQSAELPKKKERTAQVEFVAPYPLPDCVLRLRDTKALDTGFMSPGIEPSFEKVESGVYRFRIKRTWYDQRYRRQTSMVELDGYLKGIDDTSTVVIANTHVSLTAILVTGLLAALLVSSAVLTPQKSGTIIFLVGAGLILLLYIGMILWDRRTLVRLIHRAMSDEILQ
jgi:hypothetical protein